MNLFTELEKNLFTELEKKNVNHFIIVSRNYLKGLVGEHSAVIYTAFVLKKDMPKNNNLGFKDSLENKRLREVELDTIEISNFKEIHNEKYIKIQHNSDGRVYELNNDSFKKYYDSSL